MPERIVDLLDRSLTVQISVREHTLATEPFLIVGLIAVTRRIRGLAAECAELAGASQAAADRA